MQIRQPPLRSRLSRRERGVALLTLLAVVALGAALALIAMANPKPTDLKREEVTSRALAKAKEALIAYAATYPDAHSGQVPGYLPCPDQTDGNPEGAAEASCGPKDVTVIGRLPWRTLGIEPPRDGSGECLWYAISGTFKSNPKTEVMNWDTLGQIEVYGPDGATLLAGSQPENRAAAVIFSPGVALGQDRQDDSPGTPQRPVCSEDYAPARFLEAVGAINNAAPEWQRRRPHQVDRRRQERRLQRSPADRDTRTRSSRRSKSGRISLQNCEPRAEAPQCLDRVRQNRIRTMRWRPSVPMDRPGGRSRRTPPMATYDDTRRSACPGASRIRSTRLRRSCEHERVDSGCRSCPFRAGNAIRTGGRIGRITCSTRSARISSRPPPEPPSARSRLRFRVPAANGTGGQVAVVMFAGKRLAGQTRVDAMRRRAVSQTTWKVAI